MLGTEYFLKIAKLNTTASKKNQSVLITKTSSRKTKKIANPQNFLATR